MSVRQGFVIISAVLLLLIAAGTVYWPAAVWFFFVFVPVIALGVYDMLQRRHTLLRLYPVIGHFRFLFESVRKEIQQYFVESDTDGRPVSREFRSLVYQRAKGVRDTRPFGTIFDVYRDGCEWNTLDVAAVWVEPLRPLDLAATRGVDDLVRALADTAFGGRRLGEGADVLEAILISCLYNVGFSDHFNLL